LRSDLQRVAEALPAEQLLAARDTGGDVGTGLTSETEGRRPTSAAVATAACKRLTEALRAIEEYSKVVAPDAAVAAERLRYRGYIFEQQLTGRADVAGRFGRVRLYLLLSSEMCQGDPVVAAHAAIAGGVDCIQLREKDLPDRQLLELARRLRAVTIQSETLLIINDRPDIAALVNADGVHVGQDDLPVAAARAAVGGDRLVGLSTHSIEQARQAVEAGADYIGVGPMFPTLTKAAGPIKGAALLSDVAAEIDIPHVAIGGINADNAAELAEAGGRCIAVCQAILGAADPQAAARAIKERFLAAVATR
jgi:thiamine-phosphate pyrophosphorylase